MSYRKYHNENHQHNDDVLQSLYRREFAQAVDEELRYLVRAYSTEIRLGKAHPAPCSAWRSERSLQDPSKDWDARFANRVHLFAGARHLAGEDDTNARMLPTQRYLGYVTLRPIRQMPEEDIYLRYTAVAMLVIPPFMMRPRYHIISCVAGAADGVLPFRATPFFSPPSPGPKDPQDGPYAPCMHVALHAALLLKASLFHCRPISSLEMITLIWQMNHNNRSFNDWLKEGLSLGQALAVLQDPEVRGGGVLEYITERSFKTLQKPEERKERTALEALRCLTDYIANGIPILLEINSPRNGPAAGAENASAGADTRADAPDGHAVLMIGLRLLADPDDDRWPIPPDQHANLRRVDMRELPSRFVIHDSFLGPYQVVSAARLLRRAYIQEESKDPRGIRFLAVLPLGAKIGIQQVREYSIARTESLWLQPEYFEYFQNRLNGIPPAQKLKNGASLSDSEYAPRYVCRFLRGRQILRRYLKNKTDQETPPHQKPPDPSAPPKDAAMAEARELLKKALGKYQSHYQGEVHDALKDQVTDPIALHWWCVEVRAAQQLTRKKNAKGSETGTPPLAVYLWPVTMEHKEARQGPPILIRYQPGDRAEMILRPTSVYASSDVCSFSQWRPSDG